MTISKKILLAICMLGQAVQVSAYTINDEGSGIYWGKGVETFFPNGKDVFGGSLAFGIQGMDVANDMSNLYITVHSNFTPFGIYDWGDLFISTDGWDPFGTAAENYKFDDFDNGERWEYVVDTDTGDVISLPDAGTDFASYSDAVELSFPQYSSRRNQEVRYDASSNQGTDVGDAGVDLSDAGNFGFITYTVALADIGVDPLNPQVLGFKWGMTCANDTVEGSYRVLEPSPIALIGLGLLGVILLRARKS